MQAREYLDASLAVILEGFAEDDRDVNFTAGRGDAHIVDAMHGSDRCGRHGKYTTFADRNRN
jgi:hypothetical protein